MSVGFTVKVIEEKLGLTPVKVTTPFDKEELVIVQSVKVFVLLKLFTKNLIESISQVKIPVLEILMFDTHFHQPFYY